MDDQIRAIEEYVYARYIDPAPHTEIDEEAAARSLEEYFQHPDRAQDTDCYFPGVLYFELGFEDEEKQLDYFQRAKHWLDRARQLMGGEAWDVIDDRLLDLQAFFEEKGIATEEGEPVEAVAVHAPAPIVVQEVEDHGTMVLVAGGTFLFGPGNQPVALEGFYIDKFPVTNRQYGMFCRATGYRWPKYWEDPRFNNPEAPVVGVSVSDAVKFARWVGKELPSEMQWERAARGNDGRLFPWGDDDPTPESACYGRDPVKGTTDPVTAHMKYLSPYGAAEMAGNVWQWTSTAVDDGESLHVIKGGCFSDPPELLGSHLRLEAAPKDKYETIGFRCVKGI